jgi:hypothetical protein
MESVSLFPLSLTDTEELPEPKILASPAPTCYLRACLEQMFFAGKMKETKTEERKMRRSFGTKETSGTFVPEACSNNTVSQEKKHPLSPPVSFFFALARGKSNENIEDYRFRREKCVEKDVVQIFI